MTRCSGVSGSVPRRQSGVVTPSTRRSARKALRPILPVRICTRVTLSCLRSPLCRFKACGPKSAVVSAGSGRDRGCLARAAAAFRSCLVFQSRKQPLQPSPRRPTGRPRSQHGPELGLRGNRETPADLPRCKRAGALLYSTISLSLPFSVR
jgi:hypothetical protein